MNRLRLLTASVCVVAAFACGTPETNADAGSHSEDSGAVEHDAGVPDAGRPDSGVPDAGPVDAGFSSVSIQDWCDVRAMARCARLTRCLSLNVEQDGECLKREKLACDQNALASGVKDHRLQYLPQQAADCINAYASVACTEEPTECDGVFTGLVAPDGGCFNADECEVGSYCYTGENKCPYTCYAYRKLGETCDYWYNQCDPLEGRCQNVDGTLTCVAGVGEGEPCPTWSECRSDLTCVDNICIKYQANLGERCGDPNTFYWPTCTGDSFCRQPHDKTGLATDAGVCSPRAALGGVCTGSGSCETGLRCSTNYTTGTCIPLGKPGDICNGYSDCQQELYCDLATSRCLPFPKEGGDCGNQGSSYRCAPGYYCQGNAGTYTCLALKPLGGDCTSGYSSACQSNSCLWRSYPDGGYEGVCIEPCSATADGGF